MSVKTVLIAHPSAQIRDRFAAALADARYAYVLADSVTALRHAVDNCEAPFSLVVLDLGIAGRDWLATLARGADEPGGSAAPVMVFAGSVASADDIADLNALGVIGYINEHTAVSAILPVLAPHLFPDNFNRRASRRAPVALPIAYRAGQTIAAARTRDLSRGGAGVQTMEPLPAGTPIHVTFTLPAPGSGPAAITEISALGRVVWTNRRIGMGVQFDRLPPDTQRALDDFVQ
jgi:CheY-like chemotaxis protein